MQAQARASFTVRPCLDPGRAFEPEPKLVLLPSASEGKKWARMLFSARYEIEDERKTKTKKKRKKTATKNNFGQKEQKRNSGSDNGRVETRSSSVQTHSEQLSTRVRLNHLQVDLFGRVRMPGTTFFREPLF